MRSKHQAQISVRDCVSDAIARSATEYIRRETAVISGDDPEDLHQLRVAARRLRSDVRTFAPVLDVTWSDALRTGLGWLGDEVGVVRDGDVLRTRLDARIASFHPRDRAAAAPLIDRLDLQRADAGRQLRRVLSGHRYKVLRAVLDDARKQTVFARQGSGVDGPDVDAAPLLAIVVGRQWRHLRRGVGALPPLPTDAELHRIRILAKRARYAADAAHPVYGRPADTFAGAMADVQTLLGELQDSVVAETWLRGAALEVPHAATTAGMLIAIEWPVQAQARTAFADIWSEASRRSLRSWFS